MPILKRRNHITFMFKHFCQKSCVFPPNCYWKTSSFNLGISSLCPLILHVAWFHQRKGDTQFWLNWNYMVDSGRERQTCGNVCVFTKNGWMVWSFNLVAVQPLPFLLLSLKHGLFWYPGEWLTTVVLKNSYCTLLHRAQHFYPPNFKATWNRQLHPVENEEGNWDSILRIIINVVCNVQR